MTQPDWVPLLSPPFPVGLHSWLVRVVADFRQGAETTLIPSPIAPGIVPLPLMLLLTVGGIFLGTLAISRFSLKIGVAGNSGRAAVRPADLSLRHAVQP